MYYYVYNTPQNVIQTHKKNHRAQQLYDIICYYYKSKNDRHKISCAHFFTSLQNNNKNGYNFHHFLEDMRVCLVIYKMDESKMFLQIIDRIGSRDKFATKIGIYHKPKNKKKKEKNLLLLTKTNETSSMENYLYDTSNVLTKIYLEYTKHIQIIRVPDLSPTILNSVKLYFRYTKKNNAITDICDENNSDDLNTLLKKYCIEVYLFNINLEKTGIMCHNIIGSSNHDAEKIMIMQTYHEPTDDKCVSYSYYLIVDGIKGHKILNKSIKNYDIMDIKI